MSIAPLGVNKGLLTKRAFFANLTGPNKPPKACFPLPNPAGHVPPHLFQPTPLLSTHRVFIANLT